MSVAMVSAQDTPIPCTRTQGGWGSACPEPSHPPDQPGCFLEDNSETPFTIGDGFTIAFSGTGDITSFLPASGTPGVLTMDHTDPLATEAGVFAGQVLALAISVDMSNDGDTPSGLASLIVGVGPCAGNTVGAILADAESVLGGALLASATCGGTVSGLNSVVDSINNALDSGSLTSSCSSCSIVTSSVESPEPCLPCPTDFFTNCPGQSFLLTVIKFCDANVNGVNDDFNDLPGWQIFINGNEESTPFSQFLPPGTYTVVEGVPLEMNWIDTTPTSVEVTLPPPALVEFGNVCLGACGGFTLGFWSNKNGQALITGSDLCALTALNLRNADGSDFDPVATANCPTPTATQISAGKTALKKWLLGGTATNMAYMLSVQFATMTLNVRHGSVIGTTLVYAPGCGNTGVGNNFISIADLEAAKNVELSIHPTAFAGAIWRAYQECLKNANDNANNNKNCVRCDCPYTFTSVSPSPVALFTGGVTFPAATGVMNLPEGTFSTSTFIIALLAIVSLIVIVAYGHRKQ